MARDSSGTKNEPQYAPGGAPADAADLTEIAAYAALVGNLKVLTSTDRGLLSGKDRWVGLHVQESDTGLLWRYGSGGWVCKSRAGVSVTTSTAQTIPNSTAPTITFGGTIVLNQWGVGVELDTASGIFTVSQAGLYKCVASGAWNAGGSASSHYIMLSKNDAVTGVGQARSVLDTTNVITTQTVEEVFLLAAGDNIRVKAFQGSGASKALGVAGPAYYTRVTVERVTE